MGSEWKVTTLSQVTTRIGDGLHGTPEYSETGDYFFVNGNNLKNGKIVFDEKTKKVSEDQYLKHRKDIGDRTLLLSINGTLGNVAELKGEPIILGKSACYLNVSETTDKEFIKFVLTSKNFQDYLHNLSTGSTIKNASLALVRNYEFLIPNLDTQNSISSILGALDKKITTIEAINQTLEEMAQAIFKSWFVDFDPVKAKAEVIAQGGSEQDANLAAMEVISGKTRDQLAALERAHPEQYTQLHTTASLFPSAFVDSELGEIPEGWGVHSVGETLNRVQVKNKYSQKNAFMQGDVPILDQGKTGIIGYHNNKPDVSADVNDPVIVFANHTCYMRLLTYSFSAIQNVLPFKGKNINTYWLYYATLGKQNFEEYKGHWPDFVIKKIVVPDNELINKYASISKATAIAMTKNNEETENLKKIRDLLLPKLLSGEIDVSQLHLDNEMYSEAQEN